MVEIVTLKKAMLENHISQQTVAVTSLHVTPLM